MDIFPDVDKSKLESFYRTIGSNVREARKKKGLSQLEASILIGQRSTSFFSNCENYKNGEKFNLEHLYLLSKILEVPLCELIKYEE
jgi:transcriptional regulator with XRE-family HTH domain